MSIRIRKASLKDFDRFLELANLSHEHHMRLVPGVFAPLNKESIREHFIKSINDERYCLLAAEQDGVIVGHIQGEFIDGGIWYQRQRGCVINGISVDEKFRSKVVGTMLMDALKAECVKRGVEEIKLNVYLTNPRAVEFYKRLGFKEISYKMTLDL